jgi:hypothetical protein
LRNDPEYVKTAQIFKNMHLLSQRCTKEKVNYSWRKGIQNRSNERHHPRNREIMAKE